MAIGHTQSLAALPVEVAAGSAFELLVALAGASTASRDVLDPELREALDAVGDTAGETWLNLLGIPLDLGPPYDAARLGDAVEQLDPLDIRRHLLGSYAWSWCTLAGAGTIEAAAAGDRAAAKRLLEPGRYYAGKAEDALSVLLPLDPDETRARLARALDAGRRLLLDAPDDALRAAAADAADILGSASPDDRIERATGGYRYVPEIEAERVVLIPHLQPGPWLVLAQHRGSRLIVYRASTTPGVEEQVAALGRALADPKRVEILRLMAQGVDRVSGLATETGLARSTVHHHLGQLREAGLVELEGNARAYRYLVHPEALGATSRLLSELLGAHP